MSRPAMERLDRLRRLEAENAAFVRGQERMRERIAAELLLTWPGASRKARQMEIEKEG